jgi:acetyl-CoA C-acetyltransferase
MKQVASRLEGQPVYVVDGSRTPFLKARGKPGPFLASDLAVHAGRGLLARQPFSPEDFDEVIFGCIMPTPDEVNIGRVIALRLGCGKQVPAWTVQRNCGSGMQALDCAAFDISSGRADLILAGGTEAMSHAPVLFGTAMVAWLGQWSAARSAMDRVKALSQFRPALLAPVIGILRGLTDPIVGLSMGQTAEILAHRFQIDRQMMDDYAMQSHHRLAKAQAEGRMGEIEVLYDWKGNVYDHDEGVRADTTMASLAKLKPVFDRGVGKVTAGNSAQITDGAACVILASEEGLKRHNLTPLGRIVDSEWAGLDPSQMGLGPVHAATPIMQRRGLRREDIDYWEINEAFAAQVLACLAAWRDSDYCRDHLGLDAPFGDVDRSRLNVDGGGVSLGHPVGTSGARIVLHLLNVLKQNNAKRGMAALCIGGGQGGAMLVERV